MVYSSEDAFSNIFTGLIWYVLPRLWKKLKRPRNRSCAKFKPHIFLFLSSNRCIVFKQTCSDHNWIAFLILVKRRYCVLHTFFYDTVKCKNVIPCKRKWFSVFPTKKSFSTLVLLSVHHYFVCVFDYFDAHWRAWCGLYVM